MSKHARKHEEHPPLVKKKKKKKVPFRFKRFWFHLCWRKQCSARVRKETPDIRVVCYKPPANLSTNEKLTVAFETYRLHDGNGWRMDVVNDRVLGVWAKDCCLFCAAEVMKGCLMSSDVG